MLFFNIYLVIVFHLQTKFTMHGFLGEDIQNGQDIHLYQNVSKSDFLVQFSMHSSATEKLLEDKYKTFLDSVSVTMSNMVCEYNYVTIKIDNPKA